MTIEAGNLTEKDELISKFYTIRAGLSVIAEQSDRIRNAEAKLNLVRDEDENHRNSVERQYQYDCNNYEENHKIYQTNAQQKKDDLLKKEKALKKAKGERKQIENKPLGAFLDKKQEKKYKLVSFGIAIVAWVIIAVILWLVISRFLPQISIFDVAFPAFLLADVVWLFTFIFLGIKNVNKEGGKNKAAQMLIIDEKIKNLEQDFEVAKKVAEDAEIEYSNYLSCRPKREDYSFDKYRDDVIEAENEMNAVIAMATTTAKAAKEALVEYTEGLLVEDDWKNVDLLIFYLKTGRANSLQDALLLVDTQRRTDQITEAISVAAKYVGSSLEKVSVRIDSLSANMTKELNRLGSTIERNNSYLISAVSGTSAILGSQINRFNEEMSRQNQALLKAQDVNNALLERANTQSDELMEELRYNQKYWVK